MAPATVGHFFAGRSIEIVALAAAASVMMGRARPEMAYGSVNSPLPALFVGLVGFVRAFEFNVAHGWVMERRRALLDSPMVLTVRGLSIALT